jgi:hypothetical protein
VSPIVILRSEATRDRFLDEAVELPWLDSDPSIASLPQDDELDWASLLQDGDLEQDDDLDGHRSSG